MTKPWWQHHPAAEVTVDCSGDKHSVRWQDGDLVLADHDDPEGERTLAALGGNASECIEVLGFWKRHSDDLRLLALASRGPNDPLVMSGARWLRGPGRSAILGSGGGAPGVTPRSGVAGRTLAARSGPRGWRLLPYAATALGMPPGFQEPESQELLSVLMLGGGLPEILVATVLAEWSERISNRDERVDAARPALTASLFGRVVCAIRGWLNDPLLGVRVEMIEPDDRPLITRSDGEIQVHLPFRWLIDVWVRGVSVVFGRFGIQLLGAEDHRQRVMTIDPYLQDIRPVTISID